MEFTLSLNPEKFRSTNAPWNNLMLNDPWSVGYVTTLIEVVPFITKEDWEAFYYDSGNERQNLISKLPVDTKSILQNESLIRNDRNKVEKLGYDLRNINSQYGRTKEEIFRKGEILFEEVKNNGLDLSIEECAECVRFRVICETWNGVIVRERNTIETLQKAFPGSEFKKVSGEIDHKYAVDYEIYKKGRLFAAIQIKPPSYMWNAPYIEKARNANKYKNKEYLERFNVNVFDVISDSKGGIKNPEILKNL